MEVREKVVYRDAHAFKKYENREIRKNKYIEDWVEKDLRSTNWYCLKSYSLNIIEKSYLTFFVGDVTNPLKAFKGC